PLSAVAGESIKAVAQAAHLRQIIGKTELVTPLGGERRAAMKALPAAVAMLQRHAGQLVARQVQGMGQKQPGILGRTGHPGLGGRQACVSASDRSARTIEEMARSRKSASPASAPVRRWPGCVPSSSS
ncbi:hypothetical protein VB636_04115, partial [Paracoccus sp. APAP_BH8]|uniref:hypothetical protein n=1 Tax=Paracoccus sp. APAP_BH8 TaxID=3110237 RepID=UPI003B2FEB6F